MTQISKFFTPRLFLGVTLTPEQMGTLNKINPIIRNCFVKTVEDSIYLTHVEVENKTYLGKFISTPFPLKELDSLEKNIITLIGKVLPSHSITVNTLQFIPLPSNE